MTKRIDGKVNGGNVDIYVTTNEERLDNKTKRCIASNFTFDRIGAKNLKSM